jgi:hypothetical protein
MTPLERVWRDLFPSFELPAHRSSLDLLPVGDVVQMFPTSRAIGG